MYAVLDCVKTVSRVCIAKIA